MWPVKISPRQRQDVISSVDLKQEMTNPFPLLSGADHIEISSTRSI